MGLRGCPETSVMIYSYKLRKNSEERRSHLHRGESVKLRMVQLFEMRSYCVCGNCEQVVSVLLKHPVNVDNVR